MVEENQRGVGGGHGRNNFIQFSLADEARGIGPLAALDEGGGNGRTGGSGEFLELRAAGVEVEAGRRWARNIFLSSHDGGRAAGKSSRCG